MSLLTQLINVISPGRNSQKDNDDAYLSGAADMDELERRIREIDQRGHSGDHSSSFEIKLQ